MRNTYTISVEKSITLGRLWGRRDDNIKNDLK
jgi:hypothetical protein